jgi:hypothetical protein
LRSDIRIVKDSKWAHGIYEIRRRWLGWRKGGDLCNKKQEDELFDHRVRVRNTAKA